MFYFDPIYFLFILPGFLLGLLATILLKYWVNKYSDIQNINHISGAELASRVSQNYKLDISLRVSPGELNDNYDPTNSVLTLSTNIAYNTTITSVAISAHELAHAIQHKNKGFLITVRNLIVPLVSLGTNLGYFLIILGLALNFLDLSELGIILFALSTVFILLTLPIEIDASNKALKLLKNENVLYPEELGGARNVLAAAALTYVASLFESIGQILYFVFRVRRRD